MAREDTYLQIRGHLAELSDEMAAALSKPELAEHAKLYRADARAF